MILKEQKRINTVAIHKPTKTTMLIKITKEAMDT
jgi:hypothetical protein